MSQQLDIFIESLREKPEGHFFNPWYERDDSHDLSEDAPEIRRNQLETYLQERLDTAKYLFIAEALGYQGGHFSGIAMTSERILLGHHYKKNGISPDHAFQNIEPQRTSKPSVIEKGFSEPTATIMWKALVQLGLDPYQVVLWNALAWHPYDPENGMLSNRTPKESELDFGYPVLKKFLALFPDCEVIAVGKKSVRCLSNFDVSFSEVRHPANGGAPKFRRQMKELMGD